jgi:mannose-6-phosphate isomerase-like protein (cupin superfamily)
VTSGIVVRAADVRIDHTESGAGVRTVLDTGPGVLGLVRRLVDVPAGSEFGGVAGVAGELWFVIDGGAELEIGGHPALVLSKDRGLWIPPGSSYRLHSDESAGLRLDIVALPAMTLDPGSAATAAATAAAADSSTPLTRGLSDCEVERTGDREFRVLFGPGRGCSVATQFVGHIPPGRAPDHRHPYDEIVLVLQGEGVAHIGGADHVLSPGTCLHLPPGLVHCLENTGSTPLRVLGVFHPADSPAAKLDHQD